MALEIECEICTQTCFHLNDKVVKRTLDVNIGIYFIPKKNASCMPGSDSAPITLFCNAWEKFN